MENSNRMEGYIGHEKLKSLSSFYPLFLPFNSIVLNETLLIFVMCMSKTVLSGHKHAHTCRWVAKARQLAL